MAKYDEQVERIAKNPYTPYPPKIFRWTQNENDAVERAGPIALAIETVICERPLVAPSDRLLGAEAVIYMKIVPKKIVVKINKKQHIGQGLTVSQAREGHTGEEDENNQPYNRRLLSKCHGSHIDHG